MRHRFCTFALAAALALPAIAGDPQPGTTVTWELGTELTAKTGTKQYG
ncbi:MAG: hypothetical protein HUU15_03750 [Candidatus Brocadiae bacterium]|nr:hypothetical protein [Candidatus Brocadiia bacterium]